MTQTNNNCVILTTMWNCSLHLADIQSDLLLTVRTRLVFPKRKKSLSAKHDNRTCIYLFSIFIFIIRKIDFAKKY